jgi:hypothetical protein
MESDRRASGLGFLRKRPTQPPAKVLRGVPEEYRDNAPDRRQPRHQTTGPGGWDSVRFWSLFSVFAVSRFRALFSQPHSPGRSAGMLTRPVPPAGGADASR